MQLSIFDSLAELPSERRWREQAMPAPIVVAIICRREAHSSGPAEPEFLLIRRAVEPYRDHWALVGGKWDFGETLAEATIREVREETGLEVGFVALRGIVSERMVPESEDMFGAAHFLILICQVEAADGEAGERGEGAVAWFSREQISDLHLNQAIIPSDYVMLQRFVNAPAIPHYEANMVYGSHGDANGSDSARLVRFDKAS